MYMYKILILNNFYINRRQFYQIVKHKKYLIIKYSLISHDSKNCVSNKLI